MLWWRAGQVQRGRGSRRRRTGRGTREGEQRLGIDRQAAGAELDPELEVDAVTRRTSEPVAGGDRRADRGRDLAELADHRDEVAAVDDHALVEAADRAGVAHGARGRRGD